MPDPALPFIAASTQSPDWSTLSEQIVCPLCEYNLRGLIEPRCPECGYQFQWPDLLDPSRREHPYLFELNRKGKYKAFWKTAFHGLRPVKFWSALRADHRIVRGQLIAYWIAVATSVVLASAAPYFALALDAYVRQNQMPRRFRGRFTWPVGYWEAIAAPLAIYLAWPWLTLLSLLIFQISMRRANVKTAHVLRCIVYGSDIMFWAAALVVVLSAIACVQWQFNPGSAFGMHDWPLYVEMWLPFIVLMLFNYRLVVAYRHYLRFQHVISTVLSSQVIAFLAVAVVVTLYEMN